MIHNAFRHTPRGCSPAANLRPDAQSLGSPENAKNRRLLALVLVLTLAGCGGGGGSDGANVSSSGSASGSQSSSTTQNADIVTLDKGGFKLTYDCANRTATRYEYTLTTDTGSATRPSSFYLDPDLPSGCLGQLSAASYASVVTGWDRGHLVTSNHMDYSTTYINVANYMSNIVPQASTFNQGIWVTAENVAECYRDLATVYVYGGVVYNDTSNDYFVASHGIKTPDYFWKTIITTDATSGATKAISWYIPNQSSLNSLDSYIVSISELETLIGAANVGITATSTVKAMKPTTTWATPSGCDLS